MSTTTMKRKDGIAYLMRDGDSYVPCSRYGWKTSVCAPVAWRLAHLLARETGEDLTKDSLDYAMSLVVNNHDDVASTIRNYGHSHYR